VSTVNAYCYFISKDACKSTKYKCGPPVTKVADLRVHDKRNGIRSNGLAKRDGCRAVLARSRSNSMSLDYTTHIILLSCYNPTLILNQLASSITISNASMLTTIYWKSMLPPPKLLCRLGTIRGSVKTRPRTPAPAQAALSPPSL
jgi:hypothetical protein